MILHLFTLLFVTLKLVGIIDWRWLFVLAPSLIPIGIALVALFIAGCAAVITSR